MPDEISELMRVTEQSLWDGIAAARLGGRVSDISHAVETSVRAQGDYGIVEGFTGHGIGSAMHQPPNVPNVGRPGRGAKLVKGLASRCRADGHLGHAQHPHPRRRLDGRDDRRLWAAHYEHTFTLTDSGAWVLTAIDGGEAQLEALGVPYGGH